MAKLTLTEGKVVETALAKARGADGGPVYFVVLGFADTNSTTLKVLSEGAGAWAEASTNLPADDAAFIYIRKDWKVELASTTKFAYVEWQPEQVKAKRRTTLMGLRKPVDDLVKPYHVILQASVKSDVNDQLIDDRIGLVSGTASFVKGSAAANAGGSSSSVSVAAAAKQAEAKKDQKDQKAPVHHVANKISGAGGVKLADEKAFQDVMKLIKDEKQDTNFVVATYPATDSLAVATSGTTGWEGLSKAIPADCISFSLLRVKDVIDKSVTIKFVFIKCVPSDTKPVKRGEITTRTGQIEKFFQPFHVSFDIEKSGDITETDINDKVGSASGSKSHVLDK